MALLLKYIDGIQELFDKNGGKNFRNSVFSNPYRLWPIRRKLHSQTSVLADMLKDCMLLQKFAHSIIADKSHFGQII